ncbi:hypothetical protein QYF36_026950 [Acer negundo]|nr:hypothetical protein QYF36_026950 [Acer negundo]
MVEQIEVEKNFVQGTAVDSNDREQFGPWMQVSYKRFGKNIGAGQIGTNANNQTNAGSIWKISSKQNFAGKAWTDKNHGNKSLINGAGTFGNGKNLGNTSADFSKKIKVSVGKHGKIHLKKVLVEISNKLPGKKQQPTVPSKYLAKIPVEQPSFNKPFKDKENEYGKIVSTEQGRKKDKNHLADETILDMEDEIEDVEVLQSLHKVILQQGDYNSLLHLFPVLEDSKIIDLLRDASDKEAKTGIFGIGGLKAPTPDGIPAAFINNNPHSLKLIINMFAKAWWDTNYSADGRAVMFLPHIYREGNKLADGLARMGHSMTNGIVFFNNPPLEIILIFVADYRGLTYFKQTSALSSS